MPNHRKSTIEAFLLLLKNPTNDLEIEPSQCMQQIRLLKNITSFDRKKKTFKNEIFT